MTKLIRLDKDYSIKLQSQVTQYVRPDTIYIPLPLKKTEMRREKEVKKGTEIFPNTYSSVSGRLVGLEDVFLADGKKVHALKIENDFLETFEKRKNIRKRINHLTKEEVLKSIYNPLLQKKLEVQEVDTIVVSGIDLDVYLANEEFIQKTNTKAILEGIDALLNVYNNAKAIIAIKNIDSENILQYTSFLGTYTNIELRLVEDLYLIGKEEYLIPTLQVKDRYLFLRASEIYSIYQYLKRDLPLFEKYITISGDGVKNPQVVNTRIGAKVSDLLKNVFDEDFGDVSFFSNGLMQGVLIDPTNLIVTEDFEGLMVMKKTLESTQECIKCGKCISVCPIHSNPLLAYKKGLKVHCIHCGLCSYVCPSFIPLWKYLGDKNE